MQLVCAFCKKEFEASTGQIKRMRWASTKPAFGFCCSTECVANIAVLSRNHVKKLSPKRLAYSRVQNAIDRGILIRPLCCEHCKLPAGKDSLGRTRLEGHHVDYSKPLVVVWLCDRCHKKETPIARGERSAHARFTTAGVKKIRKLLAQGKGPNELGRRFGVTHKAISDIRDRKTWKHI